MEDAAPEFEGLIRGYISTLIPRFLVGYDGVIDPADPFEVDFVVNQAPMAFAGGSPNPGGMSGDADSLPAEEADMTVVLGDTEVVVRVRDEIIMRFHVHAEIAVALLATDGKLVPTVVPAASRLVLKTTYSGLPIPELTMARLETNFATIFNSQVGTLLSDLEFEIPTLFGDTPLPLGNIYPSEGGMLAVDLAL